MSYKKFDGADTVAPNSYVVVEYFVADTVADLENLPSTDEVAFGSICVCLEDEYRYVLREDGTWKKLGGVS